MKCVIKQSWQIEDYPFDAQKLYFKVKNTMFDPRKLVFKAGTIGSTYNSRWVRYYKSFGPSIRK